MRILVPVKRVLDHKAGIRLLPDGRGVDRARQKMAINPFDEIALEQALQLRETGIAEEVMVVSAGPVAVEETLRTALAMGADRAELIETEDGLEPLDVAKILSCLAIEHNSTLVLMGKQAVDSDAGQTGSMLSALLDWPLATFACDLKSEGSSVTVTREVDGGTQTLALELPAIVTVDLRLCTPRYVSLPGIMKAKKKPLVRRDIKELGVETRRRLEVVRVEEPPGRNGGRIVNSVEALVEALREQVLQIKAGGRA